METLIYLLYISILIIWLLLDTTVSKKRKRFFITKRLKGITKKCLSNRTLSKLGIHSQKRVMKFITATNIIVTLRKN